MGLTERFNVRNREGEKDLRWRVRDVGSEVGGLVPEMGGLS